MTLSLRRGRRPSPPLSRRILVVAASHGFPATKARLERPAELLRALSAAGADCDLVLWCERLLQPAEEDALESLRPCAGKLERLLHPAVDSLAHRAYWSVRRALSLPGLLGGSQHAPPRLLTRLRSLHAERAYGTAIVIGTHLARALGAFPRGTDRLIDVERIGFEAHRSHERAGRGDVLEAFVNPAREIRLLEAADAVIAYSSLDAGLLREHGLTRELVIAPPAAVTSERLEASRRQFLAPARPPRLLIVGSETPANLDGIRWFRRVVFPRIARGVPACRLRLVGEAARHIEPGPAVDRIGWVDSLEEEYRDAAMVVLPMRMGSGLRRRAVEALARHKALATTSTGAYGLGLAEGHDAVIADDGAALASEICRVLSSDSVREAYEHRAAAMARERFASDVAFRGLLQRFGLVAGETPAEEAHPSSPRNSFMCVS